MIQRSFSNVSRFFAAQLCARFLKRSKNSQELIEERLGLTTRRRLRLLRWHHLMSASVRQYGGHVVKHRIRANVIHDFRRSKALKDFEERFMQIHHCTSFENLFTCFARHMPRSRKYILNPLNPSFRSNKKGNSTKNLEKEWSLTSRSIHNHRRFLSQIVLMLFEKDFPFKFHRNFSVFLCNKTFLPPNSLLDLWLLKVYLENILAWMTFVKCLKILHHQGQWNLNVPP